MTSPRPVYLISVDPTPGSDFRTETRQKWFYTFDVPEEVAEIIKKQLHNYKSNAYKTVYYWVFSEQQASFPSWKRLSNCTSLKNVSEVHMLDLSAHHNIND